jgi:predicted nucleic acid-binding protein
MELPNVAINLRLDRAFVDTSFIVARCNRRDQYHQRACAFDFAIAHADEVWTTNAVLLEAAAALAEPTSRQLAIRFWDQFHGAEPRCRTVEASMQNLVAAMDLYRSRTDKSWSLTDCFSFQVMKRERLEMALSADRHFEQAGFRAVLLDA